MKTNMINTNSIKKVSSVVVVLIGMSVSTWGLTIELPTNTNIFSLRTSSGNDASTETSKTYGVYTYKLYAKNNCYYYNSAALFIGKAESYITFPAIANKKLTSVSIWNNSGAGAPSISICPTNSTTATTGGTAATVSAGSSATWTLTATSVNTAYRMYITNDKNLQATKIQLVYSNTAKYTVTFDAEGGTCATTSLTEANIDAGVTLPSASSTSSMSSMGWGFYGWAESAVSSPTTTAPTLAGKAGDKYYPDADITLHAVFKKSSTYCSAPKTVKVVASPAAGGSVELSYAESDEHIFTEDDYEDFAVAAANDGYEFLRWESSGSTAKFYNESTKDYDLSSTTDDDPIVKATGDATLTAYFYKNCSVTYTLTGFTKTSGPTNIDYATNTSGFTATFTLDDHYRTKAPTYSVTMGGSELTEGSGNDYTWDASTKTLTFPAATDITGDLVITITAEHTEYTKYAFSCAELTLTSKLVTAETPIFITSAASQTVRSQDSILIVGNGLTPSTDLTFPGLPSKFAVKSRTGGTLSTDASGDINAVAYIFYTPDAEDTSDGIDKLTGLSVSVGGAKPITKTLTQIIIGRHLPADFVIAAKYNKKWYALPADMNELSNPIPVEIAVDDSENPTVAYTANTNIYNLYGQNTGADGKLYTDGQTVKLGMKNNSNKPLFASTTGTYTIKGDGNATVTNNIGSQYWWTLKQTNTSITNCQDAKYEVKPSANDRPLMAWFPDGGYKWGLYPAKGAKGIEELRLIPANTANVREAYFIEYGQHGGIIEVDKIGMGAYYVKAKLNGKESPLTEFNQTQTSVLYYSTKYNYTVNFGDGIDFADADAVGKILTLEWYDGLKNMVGVTTIELPKIIASNATMTTINDTKGYWRDLEVHVLPGATLTANVNSTYSYNVTIKQLEIYPGAKVSVSTGTLNVTDLMLRNGWSRAGEKNYGAGKMVIDGSANLTHTNAYLDLYIDNDQYYPLAVPFPVTVEDIKYVYSTRPFTVGGSTGEIRLRYYDGAGRAAGNPFNWKFYGATDCLDVPETLEPSKGYAIAVKRPTGKAFSVIRLPLTFDDAWTTGGEHGSAIVDATPLRKDTVHVYAYDDEETKEADKGWNLIGNPYMGVFNGNDEEDFSGHLLAVKNKDNPEGEEKIRYVTMPNTSFTDYTQVNVTEANMQPYSSFLIQAKEDCDLVFNTSKIMPSLAPAQFRATPTRMSEQEAYIRLSNENGSDQMGLIIGEDYTAKYETNADLAKMHGELNTLKTYMVYDETDMAYVAINEELAKEWIPVSVRIPADGEYTFSLRNISVINELEGIYLNDSYTNAVINLIEQDYTFIAEAGTITERFSINAIAGHRDTPTEIDVLNAGGDIHGDKPVKFIWNNKVFIWLNGAIYDTTGKRVK